MMVNAADLPFISHIVHPDMNCAGDKNRSRSIARQSARQLRVRLPEQIFFSATLF
jgi:hypothetical protein